MDDIRKISTARESIKKELSLGTYKCVETIPIRDLITRARVGKLKTIPGIGKSRESEIVSTLSAFLRKPDDKEVSIENFFKCIGEEFEFDNAEYENRDSWYSIESKLFSSILSNMTSTERNIFIALCNGASFDTVAWGIRFPVEFIKETFEAIVGKIKTSIELEKLKCVVELSKKYESPEKFCRYVAGISPIVRGQIVFQDDYDKFISSWQKGRFVCGDCLLKVIFEFYPEKALNFIENSFLSPAEMATPSEDDILQIPIDDLDLSVRARNSLLQTNHVYRKKQWVPYTVRTLGDIAALTRKEALSLRNLGKVSLEEIELLLKKYGLEFKS